MSAHAKNGHRAPTEIVGMAATPTERIAQLEAAYARLKETNAGLLRDNAQLGLQNDALRVRLERFEQAYDEVIVEHDTYLALLRRVVAVSVISPELRAEIEKAVEDK